MESRDAIKTVHNMAEVLESVPVNNGNSIVSLVPFFMHLDGFNVDIRSSDLKGASGCGRISKRLESKAIVEQGFEKMTYGVGGSGSDGAAVLLKTNLIKVLRKQVSLTTKSDMTSIPDDKDEEPCCERCALNLSYFSDHYTCMRQAILRSGQRRYFG